VTVTAASTVRISNVALSGGQLGTASMGYALKIENSFNQSGGTFYQPTSAGSFTIYGSGWTYTAGTVVYYTGFVEVISTSAFTIASATPNLFYRLKNSLTGGAGITIQTGPLNVDGFWFKAGYPITASAVTVTCTGYTPCLGSTPSTRAELLAAGTIVESGGGSWVFGHPTSPYVGLWGWRVLRGSAEAEQDYMVDVYVKDSMCQYPSEANITVSNIDGLQTSNWATGDRAYFLKYDGTEWYVRWWGTCVDKGDKMTTGPNTKISFLGFDQWLRKQTVSIDFTKKTQTIKEMLQILIETYTPLVYDDSLISLSSNPSSSPTFQGLTIEQIFLQILQKSANEEFWIDKNMKLNVRQRVTSYGGGLDAPDTFTNDNVRDYEIERISGEELNRVSVYFGSALDDVAAANDTTRQTAIKTNSGASRGVVIDAELTRTDITDATTAGEAANVYLNSRKTYLYGRITSHDAFKCYPGYLTRLTLTELSDFATAVDIKILFIEFDLNTDSTKITFIEPADPPRLRLPGLATVLQNTQQNLKTTDTQKTVSSFTMQSKVWELEADFNLWTLAAGLAVSGASIVATGLVVDAIATSPWIVPGSGKDAVNFWWLVQRIFANNDGTIEVSVEGSVTGVVLVLQDWWTLPEIFSAAENMRLSVKFNFGGAGSSPAFTMGRIAWR
jgi:hypothetical protein